MSDVFGEFRAPGAWFAGALKMKMRKIMSGMLAFTKEDGADYALKLCDEAVTLSAECIIQLKALDSTLSRAYTILDFFTGFFSFVGKIPPVHLLDITGWCHENLSGEWSFCRTDGTLIW